MKKLFILIILIPFLHSFSGCGSSGSKTVKIFPDLSGNWLSDCIDYGSGKVNQVFVSVGSGPTKTKQANLTWTQSGCKGTYTLSDDQENPLTEPAHLQNTEEDNVSGIADGFIVAKSTILADDSVIYTIINFDDAKDEFHQIFPYTTHKSTWADWLKESEVSKFVADPAGFEPSSHYNFHFTKHDLP